MFTPETTPVIYAEVTFRDRPYAKICMYMEHSYQLKPLSDLLIEKGVMKDAILKLEYIEISTNSNHFTPLGLQLQHLAKNLTYASVSYHKHPHIEAVAVIGKHVEGINVLLAKIIKGRKNLCKLKKAKHPEQLLLI